MALLLSSGLRALQHSQFHLRCGMLRYSFCSVSKQSHKASVLQSCSGSLLSKCKYPLSNVLHILKQRVVETAQQRTFHATRATRQYRSQQPKLPWEIDSKVAMDTVLFTYSSDKLYRMITIFGIAQFFFWVHLSFFSYSTMGIVADYEEKRPDLYRTTDTWWGKVFDMQSKHKNSVAVLCIGIGYVVMFFAWLYPQRSIQKLTLLRGGKNLQITTYTHFARKRHFQIPVEHLSCIHSRTANSNHVSAKIKGKWFYFIMDKRKGKFHNVELFDFAVGLKRNF